MTEDRPGGRAAGPASTLRIDARYCGPPGRANGGLAAGLLAARLTSPGSAGPEGAVEVRLLAGIPLECDLSVRAGDDGRVELCDPSGAAVATARLGRVPAPTAPPADLAEIEAVRGRCRAYHDHPFPRCYVCGPERPAPDGLGIWPGPLGDGRVGALWATHAAQADAVGMVRPEVVWAALDCASSFALLEPAESAAYVPMVLGTISAHLEGRLRAGERAIVSAWSEGFSGRRGIGGTAVHAEDGRLIGVARAIWVSLQRSPAA